MKLKGFDIKDKPFDEATFHVLGQPVTFRAKVVSDYNAFKAAVPEPIPPLSVDRAGNKSKNLRHPDFIKRMEKFNEQQTVFMLMESLSETPDLDWTILSLEEPSTLTFDNLQKEFTDAGFPMATASKVINLASSANGLTEKLVEAGRESFSQGEPEAESQSDSPEAEPTSTPSGVPVSDSE